MRERGSFVIKEDIEEEIPVRGKGYRTKKKGQTHIERKGHKRSILKVMK